MHIASRIAALARPGEVLTTGTVRDLTAGSGLRFEDRGVHALKGISEPRQLLSALDKITVGFSVAGDCRVVAPKFH